MAKLFQLKSSTLYDNAIILVKVIILGYNKRYNEGIYRGQLLTEEMASHSFQQNYNSSRNQFRIIESEGKEKPFFSQKFVTEMTSAISIY